jgi:hypothetical protein
MGLRSNKTGLPLGYFPFVSHMAMDEFWTKSAAASGTEVRGTALAHKDCAVDVGCVIVPDEHLRESQAHCVFLRRYDARAADPGIYIRLANAGARLVRVHFDHKIVLG